jgi:hypothetical protein
MLPTPNYRDGTPCREINVLAHGFTARPNSPIGRIA